MGKAVTTEVCRKMKRQGQSGTTPPPNIFANNHESVTLCQIEGIY